ncbi:MAG: outer membrane lipoprotein-sorting protein, partial [Verrucomicrobiota bacterium]
AEPIRGTDVNCEDLALQFLYWQDAKIIGEDDLVYARYYKIELRPDPDSGSQYGSVVAWVAKKFDGVLGKAECYTPDGKLAVKLTVKSSQSLKDGARFLKLMNIERMHDGKPRDKDPTALEILGEEK